MAVPLFVVDAFNRPSVLGKTQRRCACLEEPAPDQWMQAVAAEVNLSETAFLVPRGDGDHELRWFTPTTEIDLCGHATLASAHVLGGFGRFHTRSGMLTCTAGTEGTIAMDFPSRPVEPTDDELRPWSAVLGPAGRSARGACTAAPDWVLVEARTASDVRGKPCPTWPPSSPSATTAWWPPTPRPTRDEGGRLGVSAVRPPDRASTRTPVTGSGPLRARPRGWLAAPGGPRFVGRQASARGGIVGMRLEGDRVILSGHAVTVTEGKLLVDPYP